MKYDQYRYLTDAMAKLYRKVNRLPKDSKEIYSESMRMVVSRRNPYISESMDAAILLDEQMLFNNGYSIILPESENIYRMLLGAKFKTDFLEKLDLKFNAFILMMPKDFEYEGVKLPSCLVNYHTPVERFSAFQRMKNKFNLDVEMKSACSPEQLEQKGLHICFNSTMTPDSNVRCSIPATMLKDFLIAEPGKLYDVVPKYEALFSQKLPEYEQKQQILMARLICAMSVYLQCRPENMTKDNPALYENRLMGMQYVPGLAHPYKLADIVRSSPEDSGKSTHYRSWYFRQYPEKRDGTRKDGWVFVSDTIVNENADPDFAYVKGEK